MKYLGLCFFFIAVTATAEIPRCSVIEFAELQSYKTDDLVARYMNYFSTMTEISTSNMAESKNCSDQMDRIRRIVLQRPDNKTFKKPLTQ